VALPQQQGQGKLLRQTKEDASIFDLGEHAQAQQHTMGEHVPQHMLGEHAQEHALLAQQQMHGEKAPSAAVISAVASASQAIEDNTAGRPCSRAAGSEASALHKTAMSVPAPPALRQNSGG